MSPKQQGPRMRAVALAVGMGVIGSFAFTGTSLAAAPSAGSACQAADGKVSGRGATFQTDATNALINGYRVDVCGPVAAQSADDPAGSNMLAYNYPAAVSRGLTGSGAGRNAFQCRSDAFGGTDAPFNQSQLTSFNGAKLAQGTGPCNFGTLTPPYTPTGPYPAAGDAAGTGTSGAVRAMSFPVAGGAVAIGVRLEATTGCPTPPAALNLTSADVSKLLGGDIANWNDATLVADNPDLSGCDKPVKRVVRSDSSGTTQNLKNYLKNVDANRAGATCQGAVTWTSLASSANNAVWPNAGDGTCASLQTANGSNGVIALLNGNDSTGAPNDGGIAYADLSDWSTAGDTLASVAAAVGGAFQAPSAGASSNCSFAGLLPGTNANDAVGLNVSTKIGWATDADPIRSDFTNKGSAYPICALTWDLVYTSLNGNSATTAIAGLTADQRRTLYSYFTYVLSPQAQGRLAVAGFTQLPAGFLTKLRSGFQTNF